MVVAGTLVMTWIFPSRREVLGIIPSLETFKHFNELLTTAATEMSQFATPVDDRTGFLFLTTLGVGGVTIVVDLFAVVLRRPALAGLPMLAIYSVPVAVSDGSVNPVPFALGAAGFLWLLVTDNVDRVRRFGRRFTGDGRDVDLWEPSPLAAAGQRLALVGLAFALVLPWAWPFDMNNGILERFGSGTGDGLGSGSGSGRSVSFNARLSGELNRSQITEMLRVTNVNDPNPFYLRFGVSDDLRNDGFVSRQLPTGQPINNGIAGPGYAAGVNVKTYKANIEILTLDMQYLPVYLWPTKLDKFDNSWVFDRNTATVYSGRETTKKRKYTMEYQRADFTADDLRRVQPLRNDDPIQRNFTSVPTDIKFVSDLVNGLVTGKQTQYDKVRAIFDHFSTKNNFTYDLTTGAETTGTKIVDFLQNKRGFCVQYAAAMGWLLRQAKIPSRVAFGFTRGGAKQGNVLTLTNFNLHAWTEVYFQGYGWVPFDPTPASAIGAGSVSPLWAPNPSQIQTGDPNVDDVPTRGNQSAGPQETAGPIGPDSPIDNGNSGNPDAGADLQKLLLYGSLITLGTAGLALLIAAPALARSRTRRRRLRFGPAPILVASPSGTMHPGPDGPPGLPVVLPPNDPVYERARADSHGAWDELLDTMTDYKVTIDEAETPRATGVRLIARERLRDDAEAGIRLLSTAEEHARYARRPITAAELRASLSAVREAFRARADRRTRIIAVLLPPSVTQRWRQAIGRRFADLANGLGRRRDSLVRTLSVRRLVTRKANR
jgi:transglutaminase-like putative cysteine protease